MKQEQTIPPEHCPECGEEMGEAFGSRRLYCAKCHPEEYTNPLQSNEGGEEYTPEQIEKMIYDEGGLQDDPVIQLPEGMPYKKKLEKTLSQITKAPPSRPEPLTKEEGKPEHKISPVEKWMHDLKAMAQRFYLNGKDDNIKKCYGVAAFRRHFENDIQDFIPPSQPPSQPKEGEEENPSDMYDNPLRDCMKEKAELGYALADAQRLLRETALDCGKQYAEITLLKSQLSVVVNALRELVKAVDLDPFTSELITEKTIKAKAALTSVEREERISMQKCLYPNGLPSDHP